MKRDRVRSVRPAAAADTAGAGVVAVVEAVVAEAVEAVVAEAIATDDRSLLSRNDSVEMGSARALAELQVSQNQTFWCGSEALADWRGRQSEHARARVLPRNQLHRSG